MRQTHLRHELVEYIPESLEEGVLYISEQFGTAVHKCCCGCGEEVVTPLGPTEWSHWFDSNGVTLDPSIGNWSYACRSHYLIRNGKVVWAGSMSKGAIEYGRKRDERIREQHFANVNRSRGFDQPAAPNLVVGDGMFARIWKKVVSWFRS
jgi:Family of unknown function (DUF6527)